jgi:hypothetical protein
MPRCPNGSRKNPKTGECEPTKSRNKTAKSRKSPSPPPAPVIQPPVITFNEFCKISSELYGLSYKYFHDKGGDMRHLYYVYNRNKPKFVFPKDLKKIMIGTPSEKYHLRTPYTGKAIRVKGGISENVLLKDINRNDVYNTPAKYV